MNKILIYLLFIVVVFTACRKVSDKMIQKNGHTETITIDPKDLSEPTRMASLLIDSITYIPLETSEEALVGKIEAIYEWDNRFYIWDQQSEAIFIFSKQGKFITKIAKKGRGAEEYVQLKLFYLNPRNGGMYIRCDVSQSILHYNYNGEFVARIPCKFITAGFTILGQDTLVLYGGKLPNQETFRESFPDQFRYVMMKDNRIIKKDLPGRYNETLTNVVGRRNQFVYFSDTTSFIESLGNEIYRVANDGSLIPRFSVDFGEYTFPLTFDTPDDRIAGIIETEKKDRDKWCRMYGIIETDDYLLVRYSFQGYGYKAIYSKQTQKTYNIGPIWLNDIDYIAMPSIHNSSNNYLLGSIEAHSIISGVESPHATARIKELAKNMDEMDNPVIAILKMKRFEK